MRVFVNRIFSLLLILLVLLGAMFALLPNLASTHWGRRQIVAWINRSIPGKIEIRELELHWGKGQVLTGVLLKDPEGQSVLGIEKFSTDATLWQLLNKSLQLGSTHVEDLNAAIVTNEKGWTNLQRALGIPPSHEIPPLSPSTILLSNVYADLNLFKNQHPVSAHVKGLTKQENIQGSFMIDVSLEGLQASNWKELQQDAHQYLTLKGSQEAKMKMQVTNFPVDLIDRLVALKTPHLNGFFHSILGDRLNLTMDKESSLEGMGFNLTISTPLMQGEIKGEMAKRGIFTLLEPATFHFNLSPQFVNPFTQHQFELLNLSRLNVTFSDLSFPLSFFDDQDPIDSCLVGCKMELTLPQTDIDLNSVGKVTIHQLQASLRSSLCDSLLELQIQSQLTQAKENFEINLDSTLTKPKNFSSFLKQFRQSLHTSLRVSHLPLKLIPGLHEHPEWIEYMGSFADAHVNITPKGKEEWEALLSLQTSTLSLKEAHFRLNKEISLTSPAQLNWIAPANCFQAWAKAESLKLGHPCQLQLVVKQLTIPLAQPSATKYQLQSTVPQLRFPHLCKWGIVAIQALNVAIEGQNIDQFHSSLKGQLALLDLEGLDSPLLKDPLVFTQTAHWKRKATGEFEMPFGELQVKNSITHARVEGRLNANCDFEFTQPAQLKYTLTPTALQALSQLLAKEWPKLQQDASLKLTIDPTVLHLKSADLASLHLQGMFTLNRLMWQDASGALPVLEDISLPWTIEGAKSYLSANLKGLAYSQKDAAPSQLSASVQLWPSSFKESTLATTKAEVRMNFAAMPTSVFNVLFKTHDWSPVLGSMVDLNLKAFYDPAKEKPGYLDLRLDSSQFHVDGRFKWDEEATSLSDPQKAAVVRLTITPASYQYLKKLASIENDFKLLAPFTIVGNLSQFYLSWQNATSKQNVLDCKFTTTDIQGANGGTKISPLYLEGHLHSQNMLERLHVSMHARSTLPSLHLQGILTNFLDAHQKLHEWQAMGWQADLQGQRLSPRLLEDLLLCTPAQSQKLHALFGDSLDLEAHCQVQELTGPLQASIKGQHGQLQLDGHLKEGVLTLQRPLEGTFTLTPLLSQAFLADNVPLLSSAVEAENAIHFHLDPSQFKCPLFPFSLQQVKIGKGILNLGKIRLRNEGELKSFLSLFHSFSDPFITIWFTPLYFELEQGRLFLKRLDFLVAHTYSLASWGEIDLDRQQGDLVIGLSAQALQRAFGIQGLDANYLLQIPLRSTHGKVEIDKKKATARISALIAQMQGGSTGKLLGNLLDLALSDQGEISPPPTTQPLPWEAESQTFAPSPHRQEREKPTDQKKKKQHSSQQALKSLKEEAFRTFDQFFSP